MIRTAMEAIFDKNAKVVSCLGDFGMLIIWPLLLFASGGRERLDKILTK